MSKSGIEKFVAGAAIGAGLGILFAPKSGEDTRKELKKKLEDLVNQAKNIDIEEVRKDIARRVEDIKMELVDLDKEKVLEIAKEKSAALKDKALELVELAKEKGTPMLKKTANDVLDNVIKVSKDTQKKFGIMIEDYLKTRSNLKHVFLLVDYRHKPTEDDILMYDFLKYYNLNITVVATKYDKVSKNSRIKQDKVIKETLGLDSDFIPWSTITKKGRLEVLEVIESYLEK